MERYRRGERPALKEYTDRYPEWADKIQALFPALVMMERARPDPAEATGPDAVVCAGEVRLARDPRVKAFVSQVGSMRPPGRPPRGAF